MRCGGDVLAKSHTKIVEVIFSPALPVRGSILDGEFRTEVLGGLPQFRGIVNIFRVIPRSLFGWGIFFLLSQ